MLVSASRDAVGPTLGYVALGIAFTGVVAGLIPHGALGTSMRHDDPTSPLLMALVGVPAYSGVLPGTMRIGLMFEHGNSVGASWVLFELGVGLNVGLLLWLCHQYGTGRALRWLALVVAMVVALAYAAEPLLYSAHEEASHTHAFDDWASPFAFGDEVPWQVARDKLLQKIEVLEPVSLTGLLVLFLVGSLSWRFDPTETVEAWLTRTTPVGDKPVSVWNRPVPGPVLGLVTLAGLVVFSIVALFIYYPAPEDVFKEVSRVRAEAFSAVRSKNREEGIRQLELWDLLTRKLQVGVFLRTGRLDPDAAKLAEDLRERLEEMRDALLAGDIETANALLPQAEAAYRRCRAAFRGERDPSGGQTVRGDQ